MITPFCIQKYNQWNYYIPHSYNLLVFQSVFDLYLEYPGSFCNVLQAHIKNIDIVNPINRLNRECLVRYFGFLVMFINLFILIKER